MCFVVCFFCQAEDGIRDLVRSRGLGDVYKRQRYVADFSDAGSGNGYYNRLNEGINGRVYKWIGEDPITGRPLGRYNPLSKLTAPNKRQMFTIGSTWKVDSNTVVTSEVALSGFDQNRYSGLDDGDNQGVGVNISCLLYTSPSPRDRTRYRMPSSA